MTTSDSPKGAPSPGPAAQPPAGFHGTLPSHLYAGTALISLVTLALEILVTRLLSVVTWYYLAFFAISTAMGGMTAGALHVFLEPERFGPARLAGSLAKACRGFALAVPGMLLLLCSAPLQLGGSAMNLLVLGAATLACAAPFYFSGIAVAAVLSRASLPVTRIYAADLLGAALGCLLVLLGLELLDVPSLVLLAAAGGAAAALCYAPRPAPGWKLDASLASLLTFAAVLNGSSSFGIQPIVVKGAVQNFALYEFQKWNSHSRVVVEKGRLTEPSYWGPSPLAPKQPIEMFGMSIDGSAGTTVRRFRSPADIEHLKFDVTNVAYFLRPTGGAAVIGVGGGRDVQAAVLFGHQRVDGIEVNPIFISLLEGPFRTFAGIAGRPGVTLTTDEARSHLARSNNRYRLLQMSLIDTWASTAAGAFSLSENGLYTVEAWGLLLDRLTEDGIFTVSRWFDERHLGETGRVLSLAVATLRNRGVRDPSQHLALVTSGRISTLLVSRSPLSPQDLHWLREVSTGLRYGLPVLPGQRTEDAVLRGILSARTEEEVSSLGRRHQLEFRPPTDDNPFFFNMLPLERVLDAMDPRGLPSFKGVTAGNAVATKTLAVLILCLLVLTTVTILFPLLARSSGVSLAKVHPAGAAYFSLIGTGFMFAEIGLIQRLSVFLGHPAYALGVLLFTIIASTGVGSLLSERIPLSRGPALYLYPLVAAGALAGLPSGLRSVMSLLQHTGQDTKIVATVALLFPLGMLLGVFFPTGMRLAAAAQHGETPWYWALNGSFGVLASALAVFGAIYWAISTNLRIAAVCYLLTLPCALALAPSKWKRGEKTA